MTFRYKNNYKEYFQDNTINYHGNGSWYIA